MQVVTLKRIAAVVGFSSLLFSSTQSWSHHAFGAEFDPNRPLVLRGPVTKVEWVISLLIVGKSDILTRT